MNFLKKYNNPNHVISFSGIHNVKRYSNLTRKKVESTLARDPTYVRYREFKKPKYFNPFTIYRKRDLIQSDLIDLADLSRSNQGHKYILIVCDTQIGRAHV